MKVCIPLLRTLTTWHCPHSPPAHRAAVRRAAIDRYLPPARTDGRTDARQMHRPCSAYYAGSNIRREVKMKTVTRCLHFTTRCTTGCTIGWMYYANELSQTALEQPSQNVLWRHCVTAKRLCRQKTTWRVWSNEYSKRFDHPVVQPVVGLTL